MEEKLNFTQLLQKPIAMMTGEELCFLITKSVESTEAATPQVASTTIFRPIYVKKVVDKRKTPMYNHLGVKNLSLGVWA